MPGYRGKRGARHKYGGKANDPARGAGFPAAAAPVGIAAPDLRSREEEPWLACEAYLAETATRLACPAVARFAPTFVAFQKGRTRRWADDEARIAKYHARGGVRVHEPAVDRHGEGVCSTPSKARGFSRYEKAAIEVLESSDAAVPNMVGAAFVALVERESLLGRIEGAIDVPLGTAGRIQLGAIVGAAVEEGATTRL